MHGGYLGQGNSNRCSLLSSRLTNALCVIGPQSGGMKIILMLLPYSIEHGRLHSWMPHVLFV